MSGSESFRRACFSLSVTNQRGASTFRLETKIVIGDANFPDLRSYRSIRFIIVISVDDASLRRCSQRTFHSTVQRSWERIRRKRRSTGVREERIR